MRDDPQIDDVDSEEMDDEWEDAETQERYPWLDGEDDRESRPLSAEHQKIRETERAKHFAREHYVSENGTNYHHLTELTDEHLPDLAFLRYHNLFTARTANAYLKTPLKRPARRQLFGDLWLEGELMLLFADTGLGKSALAVQIARALAGGEPIDPFAVTTGPQRVLYFDFELTDEQFAARYTDPDGNSNDDEPLFPLNFIRCAPREDPGKPEEFDNYYSFLIHSVADTIEFSGARVVIVDNITWLAASTEHSAAAQRLMRTLVDLKNQLGLSIMVIAHTPKMRRGIPVELNHLQGSKMLANFADNIIGMGRSSSSNDLRYLKPLKQRNAAARFDERSVPVFRLAREGRMLGFTFVDTEPETRHLEGYLRGGALTDAIREDRMTRAIELSNAGDLFREIAEKLGIGVSSARRFVNQNGGEASDKDTLTAEMSKNADSCAIERQARHLSVAQKSRSLKEKEVSDA